VSRKTVRTAAREEGDACSREGRKDIRQDQACRKRTKSTDAELAVNASATQREMGARVPEYTHTCCRMMSRAMETIWTMDLNLA